MRNREVHVRHGALDVACTSMSKNLAILFVLLLLAGAAYGQSLNLALSSGSTVPGGAVSLNLSLASIGQTSPAGLQWKLTYSAADISSIQMIAGPAATAAGKSISCTGASGSYTCLLTGLNQSVMADGVVAIANITASATIGPINVGVTNALGASPEANALPVNSTGGVITIVQPVSLSTLTCNPTTLGAFETSSCTVTLNGLASAGGTAISLGGSNPVVSVPSTVVVPAGASSVPFSATAGTIPADASATVTATLNTVSQSVVLNLRTPAIAFGLQCTPGSMASSGAISCTVTISKPAPAGGASVALASSSPALALPASVTVSAGATSATFSVSVGAIATDGSAVLTATLNGATQNFTVSLVAPATVSSLTCAPATLGPGSAASCTVYMPRPASGPISVILSSDAAEVTVPASVTIPASSTSASFTAVAGTISADRAAALTATLNGVSQSFSLTLLKPVVISQLQCFPASLSSVAAASCTVTLAKAAGAEGASIVLASNNPAVTVAAAMAVPAGSNSGTFAASAGTITADGVALLSATLNGSTQTFSLALTASAVVSSLNCAPTVLSSSSTASCTIALPKPAPAGGVSVALSTNNPAVSVPAAVVVAAGSVSATFTSSVGTVATDGSVVVTATLNGASASTAITLLGPAALSSLGCNQDSVASGGTALCTVSLSKPAPAGGSTVTLTASDPAVGVPGSVLVPASATAMTFTATAGRVSADRRVLLTATLNGGSQSFPLTLVGPGTVSALHCAPAGLSSGMSSSCTVYLPKPDLAAVNVTLSSDHASVTVPGSVAVATGAVSATFTASAGTVPADGAANITASLNGTSQSFRISLTGPLILASLSCVPASLASGSTATCTASLPKPAPAGGVSVTLSNNAPELAVPPSVTIPAGVASGDFTVSAGAISTDGAAVLTATLNGVSRTFSLSLLRMAGLSLLQCSPVNLTTGATANCTVTLSKPAGAGGANISLASNNPALTVPALVTVPAGSTSGTFSASVGKVAANGVVLITATLNGSTQNVSLLLVAAAAVSSLSCNASTLTPGSAATCTLSLSKPAGPGGATVSVSTNGAPVSVPSSVSVPAGSVIATFSAVAGTISADQTAVLTAALDGASVTVQLILSAAGSNVQLISCGSNNIVSGALANCSVLLAMPAPVTGITVTLSSDNPALKVPPVVTIPGGSTVGHFPLLASVGADQSATLTATCGGTSSSIVLSLLGPAGLDSVVCTPAYLNPGVKVSCTVKLTKPANDPVSVSLTATGGVGVAVPPAITVPSGSNVAGFDAIIGPVPTGGTVVLTATANGVSRTFTLTSGSVTVASLGCTPGSVPAGAQGDCTLTLSKAAPPEGAVVSLASNTPDLSVPATVTVPSGSSSGRFPVVAGLPGSDGTATVTATLNGGSKTTAISLLAAPAIASLTCAGPTLAAGATTSCTVVVARAAGDLTVSIVSESGKGLVAPSSVLIPAGSTTTVFLVSADRSAAGPVQLSAGLGKSTQTLVLTLRPINTISSLVCNPPTLSGGGGVDCAVELNEAAPASGSIVSLQANTPRLQIPAQVIIPAGAKSTHFAVRVMVSDRDEQGGISAAVEGVARTAALLITGLRPTALSCQPKVVRAGNEFTCEVRLNSSEVPEVARLELSSSSASLRTPPGIITRPRQSRLAFKVFAEPYSKEEVVAVRVRFGETSILDRVIVLPPPGPVLTVPGNQFATFGKEVAFTVTARDSAELPVVLSAGSLPGGASFDPDTGCLTWTPGESQGGAYEISFVATNSANASSTGRVPIQVDAGEPVITGVLNGASRGTDNACSPGAVGSVTGRWLSASDRSWSEPSGTAMELGGTRVRINDEYVPVLYASPIQVDFLCPAAGTGTLRISVENGAGVTNSVEAMMQDVAPGVFSLDGSGRGQGIVFLAGTSLLAVSRNYRTSGQPAQPGDAIAVRTTGLGAAAGPESVLLRIGELSVPVDAVQAVPGSAGVYEITARLPAGVPEGEAVPVLVRLATPDGHLPESNAVTVAIEAARP